MNVNFSDVRANTYVQSNVVDGNLSSGTNSDSRRKLKAQFEENPGETTVQQYNALLLHTTSHYN